MARTTKKSKMNILFAAFEASPFSKTGGLGDVAGSLPSCIKSTDCDIRIILPKLSAIPEKYKSKMQHLTEFTVPLGWRNIYCGLEALKLGNITCYFLDNEYYFKRDNIYGEFDDGERVAFFSKAILESLMHIDGFFPDVIHCNDWHTALVPVFLHEQYLGIKRYCDIKTIFTVHNLKFQGQFSDFVIGDICGLANTPAENQLRIGSSANYMQGALKYADKITTVSPSYADEICTKYYGEGLDWLFSERRNRLCGILNGIDTKKFNPKTDKDIPYAFDEKDMNGKLECKAALQRELGLEVNPDIPLYAVITRLTEQKGIDLINYNLPMFSDKSKQLVILGTGDKKYEEAFSYYAANNHGFICAKLEFNEALSKRIYAAADFFLMPSRFEPCGLSQMIAMRYACLPIVRETGGLKDSVMPYNKFTGKGTGFGFANYNAHELKEQIEISFDLYKNNRSVIESMRMQALKQDFSWKVPAKEYKKIYAELSGK